MDLKLLEMQVQQKAPSLNSHKDFRDILYFLKAAQIYKLVTLQQLQLKMLCRVHLNNMKVI